jgi:hypothetical protein
MSTHRNQFRWFAAIALALVMGAVAASASAQTGKPDYDPEVEAVARTIFLELMSPW